MLYIVWMKGGSLGDYLVGLPVLAALRSAYPSALIEAVGPRAYTQLAHGYADKTGALEDPEWLPLYGGAGGLPPRLADADLVVALRPDPEGHLERSLQSAVGGKVVVWPPPARLSCPMADHLMKALEPLGIRGSSRPEVLHPDRGHLTGDAPVIVHPGSGGQKKRWPADCFARIIGRLRQHHPVTVVLGHVEVDRGEGPYWEALGVPVVRSPDIWSLAGTLATARLYLGNDSGVSHLAAAVDCPSVVLFQASDADLWAPRGKQVRVVDLRQSSREAESRISIPGVDHSEDRVWFEVSQSLRDTADR